MKVNLAIYTAQEGYAWQPGTVFTSEDLCAFKKCIGKFPSPEANDFPFGGVFLLGDRVVFYRYHVAKKIDFRGRDALYCVLGAVSRAEAATIDPAALFARPEFAGPMKPFPTELELQEAEPSAVPEWLKDLSGMTLDVRIGGTADSPDYVVARKPLESAQPPIPPTSSKPTSVSAPPPQAPVPPPSDNAAPPNPVSPAPAQQPLPDEDGGSWLPGWMTWALVTILLAASAVLVLFWMKRLTPPPKVGEDTPQGTVQTGADSLPPNESSSVSSNETGTANSPAEKPEEEKPSAAKPVEQKTLEEKQKDAKPAGTKPAVEKTPDAKSVAPTAATTKQASTPSAKSKDTGASRQTSSTKRTPAAH